MASIDIFGIKQQIVAILKSDTSNLYDATPSQGVKTKFRIIEAGAPSKLNINQPPLPRLWVTSDTLIANVSQITTIGSNASNGQEYDVRINIVFVVEAKSGPATEEDIDDFTKLIIDKLEANYDLRDDGGAESTSKVDSSQVITIQDLPAMFKGDRVMGRVIKFKCMVTA